MASGRLFLPGWMPARDSNGEPIPNVSVSFYDNETDVLASIYADEALTVPLMNPLYANSSGRFVQIYADDSITYSASVEAPFGPAGQPFTFDGLQASQAADIAAANLAQGAAEDAEAALDAVNTSIQAAITAGGADAALAGALAGSAAGTTAANAVLSTKAETNGSNVNPDAFRTAIEALPLSGSGATVAVPGNVPYKSTSASSITRTLQSRLEDAIYLADYASGTPNSAALQLAINDAQTSGKTLYLTPTITKDSAVVITAPCSIVGVGKKTVATSTAVNINWITIQSSDVSISNIYIDDLAATGGWDFTIDTGAGVALERIQIRNVTAFHSKGGLRDTGTGTHVTVDIDNYFNRILKGPHIQFTRSFAYLDINNSTADFNGSGASGNFTAFSMVGTGLGDSAGGGKFKACHVLGGGGSALTGQIGFDFVDYDAAWFIGDVTADSCGGRGYRFTRCNKIEGVITCSLCHDHGVTYIDCSFSDMLVNGQGSKGLTGALANKDLIRFEASAGGNNSMNLRLGYLADPTGNHVIVVGTQGGAINLLGGVASGATGRALVATGASVVQWTAFVWNNNTAGNYDISNAVHWVEGVFASGGRSTFNGPGTA